MKIRSGFVSNSSTSSYVIIAPISTHEKVLKSFSKEESEALRSVKLIREETILGQKGMVCEYSTDLEDEWVYGLFNKNLLKKAYQNYEYKTESKDKTDIKNDLKVFSSQLIIDYIDAMGSEKDVFTLNQEFNR